jgi:hypothetical protein
MNGCGPADAVAKTNQKTKPKTIALVIKGIALNTF